METDPTYPIELITSYLAGEATGDDLVFLEAWLKADPGNRKIFDDYRKTWFALEHAKSSLNISDEWKAFNAVHGTRYTAHDKDAVHGTGFTVHGNDAVRGSRFTVHGKEEEETGKVLSNRYVSLGMVYRIAAIIVILLIPSIFLLRYFSKPAQEQLTANSTIKIGTLPDGTSVTLNKGAVLDYPSSFIGNKRSVRLRGEAWFEVRHDNAKPFIILSDNVKVEVLGTTFYVNTHAGNNSMEVILNSGSVAVYFDNQIENRIILAPGEKAEINTEGEKIVKDINTDPNYRAWMTQRFVYNSEPLVNIVDGLNRVYHANLRITTPGSSYCLVTATFDHQSIESILHVLQATLDLRIINHGSWTEISGKKCF